MKDTTRNLIKGGSQMDKKTSSSSQNGRGKFSGRIGYVMAVAGSAVGLGNIWRFPYVAGQQGGALFLIAYILMIVLIGFSAMIAEFAIGRNASSNVIDAFASQKKPWGVVGVFSCIVSFLIFSYYSVIGGWVIKYLYEYIIGNGGQLASDGYFTGFISSGGSAEYVSLSSRRLRLR